MKKKAMRARINKKMREICDAAKGLRQPELGEIRLRGEINVRARNRVEAHAFA